MQRRQNISGQQDNLDDALSLKAFESKFDLTEFVGSVSEKLIVQSKAESGPFDPKPFIKSFEDAVDRLIEVRKDVQAKTEQMEKSVRVAERDYSRKMTELNKGFESVGQSFFSMESKMIEVGGTAIRIGEQLETVHIERQRAQAAYDLINYYNQFSQEDTSRLDALKKDGREGRRKVAVILRRLNTVAKEVDLPSADQTQERIEKYCEKFEKDMLYLFDRCYRKGDPKMMHHCAQTLLEFNGGASCIQVYVNQHDFFINQVHKTSKYEDDAVLWNSLPDPDAAPPRSEKGLLALFSETRSIVDQEVQIVKAVFPNPPVVMQVFLQRVFAQSIQQYMEQLLNKGTSISDLAYLRMLQLVHVQASILIEDLKTYELPTAASPRSPTETAEFRRSLLGTPQLAAGSHAAVGTMLDTALEELFVPYIEGQRYLERESRSLGTLYSNLLADFTRYHERSLKGKSSVFDRMVNQLSAAAATTSTSGASTTSAQAAAALMRFGGISTERIQEEEPLREEDGKLSVDVAEKMLKWHVEALGRCVELSPPNDVAKNIFALLRVLFEAISRAYLEVAMETAQARLEATDGKVEPNYQPLTVLFSVNLICHLWQQYVNTALLPLASSSVTTRREMSVLNNQTVSRLEGSANQVTQRMTDVVISWLTTQLARQKRNDFKPRNEDLSFDRVNTEPCVACCDALEKARDAAKQNLSGKNLEVFLTEIGVAFHSLLLDHLKKFPVSAAGGLMLAKDLKMYQDTISSFEIPSLNERFEFIRQLSNVFIVRPDILKSYITENYLGRIDPILLRPYLAQRSDWVQFEKEFDSDNPDAIGGTEDGSGSLGVKGLSRFGGRLGYMVKELESLRFGEGISMGIPNIPSSLTGGFSISTRLGS